MKLFNSISADVKMQDFGTSWLIVMRGSKQEVDWVFNAFFNFDATNDGHYNWNDAETEASFFTTKKRMEKFFVNFLTNRYANNDYRTEEEALKYAKLEAPVWVNVLFEQHREPRQQYHSSPHEGDYAFGAVKAEKPDLDFKDAVLDNAFKTAPDPVTSDVGDIC